MQQHLEKVKQAKLDGKSLQLQLIGTKHLTLEKFAANGIWYTGIHDLTPIGTIIPLSGLNFDETEWDKLMEHMDEINSALAAESSADSHGVKRDVNGNEIVRDVLMYRWTWFVGKKKVGETDVCFFSEEDCKIDASNNKPTSDKASVTIEKVWGQPPKKHVHMHEVFLFILKKFIETIVKGRCEGCKVDSPSQKDHMDEGGCLSESLDYTVEYCDEALSKISPSDLVTLYESSRRSIGASTAYSDLLAETALFYMRNSVAVNSIPTTSKDTRNIRMLLDGF